MMLPWGQPDWTPDSGSRMIRDGDRFWIESISRWTYHRNYLRIAARKGILCLGPNRWYDYFSGDSLEVSNLAGVEQIDLSELPEGIHILAR